ncbi:MAG: efflux RND transporter periplasmic adaptor subunit [Pseudomonadales bacterium]|nr:efflux RND transporter periplasmic adaptor subunit [Pseudomonadales bacterium]
MKGATPQNPYIILICTLILLLNLSAATAVSESSDPEATQAAASARPTNAKQTKVVLEKIDRQIRSIPILASGRLHNKTEYRLGFKTGGLIQEILVEEGQQISRGQLLATLDLKEISALVAQAEAAKARAYRDVQRAKKLKIRGVMPEQLLQDAETELSVRQADLDMARFNQKYSQIRAPADGYILLKKAEPNELVAEAQTVLTMAADATGWVLRIGLADQDIVRVALGDKAKITLDAFPNQQLNGEISEISRAVNRRSGIFEIEILLQPVNIPLYAGFIATAELSPAGDQSFAYIPIETLVNSSKGKGEVYVYEPTKGTAKRIKIDIAFLHGSEVVVSAGLNSYQNVIRVDNDKLIDDGPVTPVTGLGFQHLN